MKTPKKTYLLCFLTLMVVGLLGISPAANASDDPSPRFGFPSEIDTWSGEVGKQFLDNNQKLGDLKGWIITQPGVEESGYIDQINDVKNLSVQLLWKGSSSLRALALEKAAAMGITVTIVERPYSIKEIQKIQNEIFAASNQFEKLGFKIKTMSGVQESTSAIGIEGVYLNKSVPADSVNQPVAALAGSLTGAQFTVREGDAFPATATRQSDSSPFWAGGYMSSRGSTCSSGFALRKDGVNRITTARHCVPPNGTYYQKDGNGRYGRVIATEHGGAANMLSGAGAGQMFDGAYNDSSGYHKRVAGLQDVGIGSYVCTSGGNSGVHCNIRVTAMQVPFNDDTGNWNVTTIRGVQQTSGQISAIRGDSGGPVLSAYSDGSVGAVGMIQAIEEPYASNCGSVRDSSTCSATVLFTSMRTIADNWNASLVTG